MDTQELDFGPPERRVCGRCRGLGYCTVEAFEINGRTFPERRWVCGVCQGDAQVDAPDLKAILEAVAGRQGLRSQRPHSARARYVWSLARMQFGVGARDYTAAVRGLRCDPWRRELDALAAAVVKRVADRPAPAEVEHEEEETLDMF